ncbi:MAG TPA: lysophospholipid acyltransferase family protein [Candidatus Limnocylindria bacterium]|nr:lysophospholipid acyltransferase family protein [Candidatus Limnocylindria bacterium]
MKTWFYHPGATIIGALLWFVGPARIEGAEHLPRSGPAIIIANHCSLMDPPMLGWATGHQVGRVVHFMAKVEMRRWPVIGWLARNAGVFFVRRGEGDRAAQRVALEHLAEGRLIGIFPEGTRNPDGALIEGKPGVALLAMRAGVPIIPVGITGTARRRRGPLRWLSREPITFHVGEPFRLVYQPSGRLDRAELERGTDMLMRAIATLLPEAQQGVYRVTPIQSEP